MNLRRMSGEAVVYAAGNAIEAGVGLAVVAIVGRYLRPDQLGIADVITATAGLLYFAIGLNLDQPLYRYYYDESDDGRRKLVTTHAIFALAIGAVVVGAGVFAVREIAHVTREQAAWTFGLASVPFVVLSDHLSTHFRLRHEPAHHISVVSIRAMGWLTTIAALLMVWQLGVVALFIGRVVGAIAACISGFGWVHKAYSRTGSIRLLKRSLRFAAPTLPAVFGAWAILYAPRYLLAAWSSLSQVGYYGIGVRMGYILSMVGLGTVMAWMPFVMGLKEDRDIRNTLGRGLLYFAVLNTVLVGTIAPLSHEIVRFLVGPAYVPASPLVPPMLAAAAFSNVAIFLFAQVSIAERTGAQSVAYLTGAAAMVLINVYTIPTMGGRGAALATLAGQVVSAGAMLYAAQRFYPMVIPKARLLAILAIFAGAAVCATVLVRQPLTVANEAAKASLVGATWLGCAIVLGRHELRTLSRFGRDVVARGMAAL